MLNVTCLFSIERIETQQILSTPRDYSLSYFENDTAISHWYGSDTWAVKIVAEDFRPNVLSMTINAVNIYFPTIPENPVNIRAFTYDEDSELDPLFGDLISQLNLQNITINEIGWNTFPLTGSYTGQGIWLIVDNVTNFSDNFMATTAGEGTNSFYKISQNGDVAFNSFYDINVRQELLYSVEGYLNLDYDIVADSIRVELLDVAADYSHEDLWEYKYNIRNYSEENLTNAVMEIEIQHPDPEVYDTTYTYLELNIPALSDTNHESRDPIYLQLPIEDSQYKITSRLLSAYDGYLLDSDLFKVTNFSQDSDLAIIMNFLSANYELTEGLLESQRELAQSNWLIFNYGIDGSDQLFYSDYAYNYYQSLGINLNPLTLINGTKYFNSYNLPALEANLENNIYYIPKVFDISDEGLEEEDSSLIYFSHFNYGQRYVFDTFTDDLAMDVFISQKTKHYSEAGDEFILSQVSDAYADFQRLNEEGEGYFEFSYDTDSVDSLMTNANGEKFANVIIYRQDSNEIVSYHRYNLINNVLVSNQDNDLPSLAPITIYPNPINNGKYFNIKTSGKEKIDFVSLYNLRGQKVAKLKYDNSRLTLPKNIASGIYFLRATYQDSRKSPLRKLSIIKE